MGRKLAVANQRPPFDPRSLEVEGPDTCTPEQRKAAEDRHSLDIHKRLDGVFQFYMPTPAKKDGSK